MAIDNALWGKAFTMAIGFYEILLEESHVGKIVTLRFKERLRKKDYDDFVPKIEGLMGNGSKIRLVVELHDFKGWTMGALWEDTKFAVRHFNDIERLAVVGDTRWEKAITIFVKPFSRAKVKYFDMKAADQARQWVQGG